MVVRPAASQNEGATEFEPLPTYLELALAAATAHDVPKARRRKGFFLWRLSSTERAIAFAIAGLALYGLALIGDGFLLKAKAGLIDQATGSVQPANTKPLLRTE
ncbi:sortase A [Rhizobium leguminosarum]|uniref:Sortase A n=1 Tax=Rhizobium leguminosarum TaxID=384 RepID=A0AAE2MKP1_RHILE|nr:sortase A [Rhizobium leguminosarum]MBB4430356.1 sortase A [Rhizobium esperanzae]MBB4297701.1 sortase A [Rhizobium leguminosarum]MBB4308841.1 sortase A [Rhizobium leguminosarum]MBB4416676.1 sortase A [Rhizobium leguminosarum]